MIRILFRLSLFFTAALAFLGASLLSSQPIASETPAPRAVDVGASRMLAIRSIWAVRQNKPTDVSIRKEEIASAARLISHSAPELDFNAAILADRLRAQASLRLAEHTWLNLSAHIAAQTPDGTARIHARAGKVALPPQLSEAAANFLLAWLWADQPQPPPTLDSMFTGVQFDPKKLQMTVDVPQELTRALRRLSGHASEVSTEAAWDTYAQLTEKADFLAEQPTLPALYRMTFADSPVAAEVAVGRTVGMAAAIVGPGVMQMAGAASATTQVDAPTILMAQLGGRNDLAKHFTLSAALATSNSGLGSALGEWKELDDSLPGGSGFSFVDLTADRAGLRLGQALADPARTARVQALLARAEPGDLLPPTALRRVEGLTDSEFEEDMGTINSERFRAVREQIDKELDQLPLYAE
ncbi:hypothetical protein ACSMXM_04685 [Pacificimonas sp. ICDLI1SI03]